MRDSIDDIMLDIFYLERAVTESRDELEEIDFLNKIRGLRVELGTLLDDEDFGSESRPSDTTQVGA